MLYTIYSPNLFNCQRCPGIEASQMICTANQLTGFYMRATLAFSGLLTTLRSSAKVLTASHSSLERFE